MISVHENTVHIDIIIIIYVHDYNLIIIEKVNLLLLTNLLSLVAKHKEVKDEIELQLEWNMQLVVIMQDRLNLVAL